LFHDEIVKVACKNCDNLFVYSWELDAETLLKSR
jgi:hypothetical protein